MAHVTVPVSAAYKGPNKKDKKAIAAAATRRTMENASTAKTDLEAEPRTSCRTDSGASRAHATSRTTS
eukprot:4441914-Pleurochrysis_carterae.AAC.1